MEEVKIDDWQISLTGYVFFWFDSVFMFDYFILSILINFLFVWMDNVSSYCNLKGIIFDLLIRI